MNYYVDIVDTQDDTHVLSLKFAERDSVSLSHKGNDDKTELKIVGSALDFTMEVAHDENVDAAFFDLYTGDETRFKVLLKKESDESVLWQGFLLPDTYEEPHIAGTFYVKFSAVDGLGRLKGKFLPDSFYEQENDVASIVGACLQLTGLSLPFYLSLGVENYTVKNYHEIYIPGPDFVDKDKKLDAYKILDALCNDTVSCVYQQDNRFYVTGLNKRNLVSYDVKSYDASGVYIEDVEAVRVVKDVTQLINGSPNVSIVSPYGYIRIEHERGEIKFKDTQAKEKNDGWVVTTGVEGLIYATDWRYSASLQPKAKEPDYNVYFENSNTNVFDVNSKASLRNKIYLKKSMKMKIELGFDIIDSEYNQNVNLIDTWINPIDYEIKLNNIILFSNKFGVIEDREQLRFENSKSEKLSFDFVVPENGLLDVVIYQPYKTGLELEGLELSEMSLEEINAQDSEVFEEIIDGEYTNTKEHELEFADDATGFSKAFQLQKLDQQAAGYTQITLPNLYSFSQNGKNYTAVSLQSANLIADNMNDVEATGGNLPALEVAAVIYNYQDNEEMIIEHNIPNFTEDFQVRIYARDDGPTDRDSWEEWTDAAVGVGKQRFAEVVKTIFKRMMSVAHPQIDVTVDLPVAFGDIVKYKYQTLGNYFVIDSKWNIDDGSTQLRIVRAVYQTDDDIGIGDNIAPFVDAGNDIYISSSATQVNLSAAAGDPDGFITAYQWQQQTSEAGVIQTPLAANTLVTGLTGDFYTFEITVVDNQGATATDTVNVIRLNDYLISLVEQSNVTTPTGEGEIVEKVYDLSSSPALPNDFNLNIDAEFLMDLSIADTIDDVSVARIIVNKNGVDIVDVERSMSDFNETSYDEQTAIPFNYRESDTVLITVRADAYFFAPDGDSAQASCEFKINTISFAFGNGNITTALPLSVVASATT